MYNQLKFKLEKVYVMKKIILMLLVTFSMYSLTVKAELINDFNCSLNKGYTVPQLYKFQQEWMQAAVENGFDATYKTRVLFPLYAERTDTNPLYFIWRGYFKDGEQWGRMMDWFPASVWTAKFMQVMECGSASLWNAPQ